MEKIAGVALAMVLSLCMFGCSTGESPVDESTRDEPKSANVGDPVIVTGNWGDLEVTVESFEDSPKSTADMLEYGHIKDDQHVGLLKMVVNNVSCDNGDDSNDYVNLPSSFYVTGPDGVNLTAMNTAFDFEGYDGAAGATFACPVGQSKRIAVFYPIDTETSEVTVHAGSTTIAVPVTLV